MEVDEKPPIRYRFEDPVDALASLDARGIEHLEVSAERTIVIYTRTIVNLEVPDGQLRDARTVAVDVFEFASTMDAEADPAPLIERLIETIATVADVDWDSL